MRAVTPPIACDDALFLDFDGTLADIAATPESVRIDRSLPQLLTSVSRLLGGAVAVISGRSLAELTRLLQPFEGAAAGTHGFERRTARGEIICLESDTSIEHARQILKGFASKAPGVVLEDKGAALALHYRARPDQAFACLKVARDAARKSGGRLVVMQGKMVAELRPPEANKGRAIACFLAEPPFQGRRPIFVGDDRTDEDGFTVVNNAGGVSVHVGHGGDTSARFQISDVPAVIAWLSEFVASPPSPKRQARTMP